MPPRQGSNSGGLVSLSDYKSNVVKMNSKKIMFCNCCRMKLFTVRRLETLQTPDWTPTRRSIQLAWSYRVNRALVFHSSSPSPTKRRPARIPEVGVTSSRIASVGWLYVIEIMMTHKSRKFFQKSFTVKCKTLSC